MDPPCLNSIPDPSFTKSAKIARYTPFAVKILGKIVIRPAFPYNRSPYVSEPAAESCIARSRA
jgi:hypothetical protein